MHIAALRFLSLPILCFLLAAIPPPPADAAPPASADRPAMRDFMGLNTHTLGFKPDLYAPVCRHVRDYHPFDWDTGKDTASPTHFPMAANGVSWEQLYGNWTKKGFDVDACVMFDNLPQEKWNDPAKD